MVEHAAGLLKSYFTLHASGWDKRYYMRQTNDKDHGIMRTSAMLAFCQGQSLTMWVG